jgi:leader peptidase (prepilin peptidase)/N-methyltransferase
MAETLLSIYIFGVGTIIGSFLNVLIYRLPRHEGFILKRSRCPQCSVVIRWYDNIPLLSYLILRGKCRHCKGSISAQYPLIELITGLIFLGSYHLYGFSYQMIGVDILLSLLLAVIVVDFRHFIIPDLLTIPGIILGLLFSLYNPAVTPLEAVIGLLVGGGVLYLLALVGDHLLGRESLGGGDIKLAAMLGTWLGWQNLLLVFFAAAVLGLLYALVRMAVGGFRQGRLIPFGPFLSLAAVLALLWGDSLIQLYIDHVLTF